MALSKANKKYEPTLPEVRAMIAGCSECKLNKFRYRIAFGRGDVPCDLLILCEAPGNTENQTGKACTGQSGQLLDSLLTEAKIKKIVRVYRMYTVLCRPSDSRLGAYREPEPDEVLACMQNIKKLVDVAKPKAIILSSKTAQRFYGSEFPDALHIMHPSALVRTGSFASPHWLTTLRSVNQWLSAKNMADPL